MPRLPPAGRGYRGGLEAKPGEDEMSEEREARPDDERPAAGESQAKPDDDVESLDEEPDYNPPDEGLKDLKGG